jgi:hypothetical protein
MGSANAAGVFDKSGAVIGPGGVNLVNNPKTAVLNASYLKASDFRVPGTGSTSASCPSKYAKAFT